MKWNENLLPSKLSLVVPWTKRLNKLTDSQTKLSDVIVWAYYNAPQAIVNPVHQVLFFLGEGLVKMTLGLV